MRTIKQAVSTKTLSLLEEADREEQVALENALPPEMKLFLAYFQKTFRRHNLIYHQEKKTITCRHFPFGWADFEYSGMIKISFLRTTEVDYKEFRKECIDEFNELFAMHRIYWNYPYDTIRIYGNEAAHGINSSDINAGIRYFSYLIKELTVFFEVKEEVLLKTPLYGRTNTVITC